MDGTYTLAGNIGGWQNFNVTISLGGTSITPAPEPINCALAGFGLIFACGSAVRFYASQRRSKAANQSFAKRQPAASTVGFLVEGLGDLNVKFR